jgi:hypothetical protein
LGHTNLGLCDPLLGALFLKMNIQPNIDDKTRSMLEYIRKFDPEHKKKVLTLDIHQENFQGNTLVVKANFSDLRNEFEPLRIKSYERINNQEIYRSFLISFQEYFHDFRQNCMHPNQLKLYEGVDNAILNARHNFYHSLYMRKNMTTINKVFLRKVSNYKQGYLDCYLQTWLPNTSKEEEFFAFFYKHSEDKPAIKVFLKPDEKIISNKVLLDKDKTDFYINKLVEKTNRLTNVIYRL